MVTTTLEEALLTHRFQDTLELLTEKGLWAEIKRFVMLKDMIRKTLRDIRPNLEYLEKHFTENVSEWRQAQPYLRKSLDSLHEILLNCEKSYIHRIFLKSEILELRQVCETLEDLYENLELALYPTFKRSVEQALSELPPDVGSKAKEELNDWLHHS